VDFSAITYRRGSKLGQASCEVLADRPSAEQLNELGIGGPSEEKAGLVVIDEAGTFLNARTWGAEDRANIIRWMLLSRKRRWDMILIVQAVGILDKQIREAVVEVCGRVRRMDRIKVPGTNISLPRVHLATMRYGTNPNDVVIERWWTRGDECIKCYDTTALFADGGWQTAAGKPHPDDKAPTSGAYWVLPASLSKWRYIPIAAWRRRLRGGFAWVRAFFGGPAPVVEVTRPRKVKRPAWVERLRSLPAADRVRAYNLMFAAS
jgi:hypothetical protein